MCTPTTRTSWSWTLTPTAQGLFSCIVSAGQFNDGVNPNDFIQNTNDGRFTDSWGEFGIEGAAQANLCDIEENPTCGR